MLICSIYIYVLVGENIVKIEGSRSISISIYRYRYEHLHNDCLPVSNALISRDINSYIYIQSICQWPFVLLWRPEFLASQASKLFSGAFPQGRSWDPSFCLSGFRNLALWRAEFSPARFQNYCLVSPPPKRPCGEPSFRLNSSMVPSPNTHIHFLLRNT